MMDSSPYKLLPDHLADLLKSGLTDETIETAGLSTARPHDLRRISGWTGTGLVFPYHGNKGYSRIKLFPPKEIEGRQQKYWQQPGSPNHLYIPPKVLEAAKDKTTPIYFTEGEKKALAALQSGLSCICIPGLWNWSDGNKNLITDFSLIDWNGRAVTIIPDNDFKKPDRQGNKKNLVAAVFGLAYRLIDLGARVSIVYLPDGPAKGLDDYLLTHPVDDLKSLTTEEIRKASLEDAISQATNDDLQEILKRIASIKMESEREIHIAKLSEKLKIKRSALAKDLKVIIAKAGQGQAQGIDNLDEADIIHSSVDFYGDTVLIGFRVTGVENDSLLTIVSGPAGITISIDAKDLFLEDRALRLNPKTIAPFLRDSWSMAALKSFRDSPTPPEGLFSKVTETLEGFLDLQDKRAYYLLSVWAVGTFFAWAFSSFPFLHFYGPKETGKSKTLEALRCLSYCGWKGRDLTTAALGDTVEGLRGTILLDQAERLPEGLVGLLADSYKRAGGKRRVVEMTQNGRSVQEFSTYGPKAFASTKDLDPDLRDRCIRIQMIRTSKQLPDLEGWEHCWGEIRDMMFRFLLTKWPEVRAAYSRTNGDGSRNTELWRPLQAVLEALEVDGEIIAQTREFFQAATETTRHELSDWEIRLFDVLLEKAEGLAFPFEMTAEEILKEMDLQVEKGPSARWVSGVLGQFSLFSGKRRVQKERKRQIIFIFDPVGVVAMAKKYIRDTPSKSNGTWHQEDIYNKDERLEVPQEKKCQMAPNATSCQESQVPEGATSAKWHHQGEMALYRADIVDKFIEVPRGISFPGGIQGNLFESGPAPEHIDLTGVEFEVME